MSQAVGATYILGRKEEESAKYGGYAGSHQELLLIA